MIQNLREEPVRFIMRQRQAYDQLNVVATNIVSTLNIGLKAQDINLSTGKIIDNTFEFSFWGLKLIVKAEILFDEETQNFKDGELNTYHLCDESLNFIYKCDFDYLGNINNRYNVNDFPINYYIMLFFNVIDYARANDIRFQFV